MKTQEQDQKSILDLAREGHVQLVGLTAIVMVDGHNSSVTGLQEVLQLIEILKQKED